MYNTEIRRFFDANHQLADTADLITKKCHNFHGHTYGCIVRFNSREASRHGMVVDFSGIKNIVDIFDHTAILKKGNEMIKYINLLVPSQKVIQMEGEPTAENIAKDIYSRISLEYPDLAELSVSICEGYKGPERASWVTYSK